MSHPRVLAAVAALALVLTGCGSGSAPEAKAPAASPTASGTTGSAADEAPTTPKPAKPIPLRKGEKRQVLRLAKPYTPSPPSGVGSDDYHCFLLDPKLTHDTAITGYDIRPDNLDVVHHVILFRVPPDKVDQAKKKDAETPGDGWTLSLIHI